MRSWSGFFALLIQFCAGCPSEDGNGTNLNSETNWLRACDSDAQCGTEESCICNQCTTPCDPGGICPGDHPEAACIGLDSTALDTTCSEPAPDEGGICLKTCDTAADCYSSEMGCIDGYCVVVDMSTADGTDAGPTDVRLEDIDAGSTDRGATEDLFLDAAASDVSPTDTALESCGCDGPSCWDDPDCIREDLQTYVASLAEGAVPCGETIVFTSADSQATCEAGPPALLGFEPDDEEWPHPFRCDVANFEGTISFLCPPAPDEGDLRGLIVRYRMTTTLPAGEYVNVTDRIFDHTWYEEAQWSRGFWESHPYASVGDDAIVARTGFCDGVSDCTETVRYRSFEQEADFLHFGDFFMVDEWFDQCDFDNPPCGGSITESFYAGGVDLTVSVSEIRGD